MEDLRCRYCHREFWKRDHLFRHERVHTKEKPYSCPTCHARFSRQDVLKRHERRHTRSSAESTRTISVNSGAADSSLNDQLPSKKTSRQESEAPALLGLPLDQSTQSETELWNSTLTADHPTIMGTTLDELSHLSFPPHLAPANHHGLFDVSHEAWDLPNGVFPTSTSHSLPSQTSTSGDSTTLSSIGLWNHVQRTNSETEASGSLEKGSIVSGIHGEQSKKDRRTRLIEAMHKAWPSHWSINDFKMSMDTARSTEEGTLSTEKSTLKVYENLTAPMVFDHSLSPNLRFMNMCFKLYVEFFWARFPIVHLPSLAPSWENNHLLFFSMCVIGSAFAGSREALEFGNRLHERIGFLIMSKWKSIMASNSSSSNQTVLILMQIHIDLHALLLGDSDLLARSVSHWGAVVLWARRAGILQDLVHSRTSQTLYDSILQDLLASELHRRWRDWVDEEMKLRVSYAIAIIDAELSSIFSQPPLVKFKIGRVRALAPDALFAAQTAEEWRDIARREEVEQNSKVMVSYSEFIPRISTHANEDQNPGVGNRRSEIRKHRLEKIFAIATIATEISMHRSGLFEGAEISLQQQDIFFQQLVECLPPLFSDKALSTKDCILGTIVSENAEGISEESLETNILWHSTLISLYVDRYALERYHGSEGIQTAQSTLISLPPAVTMGLMLHCLVIRCLAQKYSQGRHHLPIFIVRSVLLAGMAFNWYQDQKRILCGNQQNIAREELDDTNGVCGAGSESLPVRFEDWINRLNPKDPFAILIQNRPTREKLQSMLDEEDITFSMATALRQSGNVQGNQRNFSQCLDILANYEIGLVVSETW